MTTVALSCALVREVVSARADDEETWLGDAEIDAHVAGCPRCRRFDAGTAALRRATAHLGTARRPPDDLLAAVAATRRTPAVLLAVRTALTRLHPTRVPGRVPLAVAAMAIGVALPLAPLSSLVHFDHGHTRGPVTCSVLLVDHAPTHRP